MSIRTVWPEAAHRNSSSFVSEEFASNPLSLREESSTGALEVPAHLRAEISGALMTEVRSIHYRLYLLQTLLYLETLWLKGIERAAACGWQFQLPSA